MSPLTRTVLQDQPHQVLGDDDLVETGDVRMEELAMVVDLAGQVRVVLLGRFKYDLAVD